MVTRPLLLVVALLAVPAHASTLVYKCVNEAGKVTYSESPCYGERWHRMGAHQPPKPRQEPVSQPAATPAADAKSPSRPRTAAKMPTPP